MHVCVRKCEGVCVCERERGYVCVRECVCVQESVRVCVYERVHEGVCACVRAFLYLGV